MVATWTPEMAARRLALVRQSLGGALPAEERAELGELNQAMNERRSGRSAKRRSSRAA